MRYVYRTDFVIQLNNILFISSSELLNVIGLNKILITKCNKKKQNVYVMKNIVIV